MSRETRAIPDGSALTADPYGPLACLQVGQDQCVVDLPNMRGLGRFRSEAYGIIFNAMLVSEWRQWFGFETDPVDKYKMRLRSVSVDTGETIFVSKPISFTWSLVQIAGGETVGAIHEKKGLLEFDRHTGEVTGTRPECRDYHCVDLSGVALVQRSRLNVWVEIHGRRLALDVKSMRRFLDAERERLPPNPDRPKDALDLGSKRPISLFWPTLARSMVLVQAERSIVGFSVETGELVFAISPMSVYSLAYHPERDTLVAMGWDDVHASLGSRVLTEIDLDTRHILWSRRISCVPADRKQDPAGFLCDHGRYALLPDRTILTVGASTVREVPRDLA